MELGPHVGMLALLITNIVLGVFVVLILFKVDIIIFIQKIKYPLIMKTTNSQELRLLNSIIVGLEVEEEVFIH